MLPDLDTHAAALKLDRDLVLKRAERRALRDAAGRPEPSPVGIPVEMATARDPRLARLLQSLRRGRWVLRPAHA